MPVFYVTAMVRRDVGIPEVQPLQQVIPTSPAMDIHQLCNPGAIARIVPLCLKKDIYCAV